MGDSSELAPALMSSDSDIMSPGPSPAHTRSHVKARKTRIEQHFIKVTKVKE